MPEEVVEIDALVEVRAVRFESQRFDQAQELQDADVALLRSFFEYWQCDYAGQDDADQSAEDQAADHHLAAVWRHSADAHVTLEAFEEDLDHPPLAVELEDLLEAQAVAIACGQMDLPVLEFEQIAAGSPAFSLRVFLELAAALFGDLLGQAERDQTHRQTLFLRD